MGKALSNAERKIYDNECIHLKKDFFPEIEKMGSFEKSYYKAVQYSCDIKTR